MPELPPLSQNPEEAFVQIAKENELGARRLIRDLVQCEKPTPFHFIFGRILEKVIVENKRVALDPEADISDLAWAARSLMELLIWSRYIRQSEANLKRFENDFYVNAALTMQALLRLQNDFRKEFPVATRPHEGMYRMQAEMQKAREEAGLASEGPLMAGDCSKKVGLQKEYNAFSSVTSTLVHPTALSTLKTFHLNVYRPILVTNGLMLASRIIVEARQHIVQYGMKSEK
jgi:hypothetical protein